MGGRANWLVVAAALLAGVLGLLASLAVSGGGLESSPLGQTVLKLWHRAAGEPPDSTMRLGDRVPPLRLKDLQARPRTVPTGQLTLINYWASWCEPCRREMPLLDAFSRSQVRPRVQVVGVALDSSAAASNFLADHPVSFPILLEPPSLGDSSVRFGNPRGLLPFTVLISADGTLLKRRLGPFHSQTELQTWLAEAAR